MKFLAPLVRGHLLKRYKRFLADVALDTGEAVTASCANTGAMFGLADPGMAVWLSWNDNPARKYRYTWEMTELTADGLVTGQRREHGNTHLVGINTGHPNTIVAEALAAGRVAELTGYDTLKREVKYGAASRIDLLLSDPAKGLAYVEVKNVHLMRTTGLAEFPDCRTLRGVKHLEELSNMVAAGHRAVMLYLIQRGDAERFGIAADIDPRYGTAHGRARDHGVEMLVYRCRLSPEEIVLDARVPWA